MSRAQSCATRRKTRTSTNTRAQVLIEVNQAYYQALASDSVLKVAQATLDLRRLTLRQVRALAQSALRSTVDVSFAEVNVSQAELDLFRAENDARASHVRLSAAMGYDRDQPFSTGRRVSAAATRIRMLEALIAEALRERPDLIGACSSIATRSGVSRKPRKGFEIRLSARRQLPAWPRFATRGCRKHTAPPGSMSTFRS